MCLGYVLLHMLLKLAMACQTTYREVQIWYHPVDSDSAAGIPLETPVPNHLLPTRYNGFFFFVYTRLVFLDESGGFFFYPCALQLPLAIYTREVKFKC